MTRSIETSPSEALLGTNGIVNYRSALLALPGGDNTEGAIELPRANPRFDLFASTDRGQEWGINAYLSRDTASPAECAAIAAAFTKAAMQAEAMNAPTAIAIPLHPNVAVHCNPASGMLTRSREPNGRTSFSLVTAPYASRPGETWGDDGWSFEALGWFRHIGSDTIDGTVHEIFMAVLP